MITEVNTERFIRQHCDLHTWQFNYEYMVASQPTLKQQDGARPILASTGPLHVDIILSVCQFSPVYVGVFVCYLINSQLSDVNYL